ncbi:MAG: DUF2520 domain-containing protein [Acidobacteriota bacterium]|nr:MAG: DUF2520 domain-containing protein [Acidobacteriota bacterium]
MYSIIGSGRVAHHFSHYFELLGLPFKRWWRPRAGQDSENPPFEEVVANSSHVLLLISDGAIEPFVRENWTVLEEKVRVHFSGSLVSSVSIGSHPLLSFTSTLYPAEIYPRIPFILERDRGQFHEVLPGLENPHYLIDPSAKAYYHALCVLSGNFTTLLWDKFFCELSDSLDIPQEAGFLYLEQICSNLKNRDIPALTGPLARRDLGTIEANLKALEGDRYREVYLGFLKAFGLNPDD